MGATLTEDDALVVLAASSAPSVHNSQPWQFSMAGDQLLLSADPDRALWVSDPTARALRQQLAADVAHQAELRHWIAARQDADVPAHEQPYGIPFDALPLQPDRIPSPVRDSDFLSAAPEKRARAAHEQFPQMAVLSTEKDEPEDWLRAGQALQHVLLVATACGLSASLLYHLVSRDDMHEEESEWWPWPENRQMIIRFGYGEPPVPVPRRPLTDIMPAFRDLWRK